MFVTHQPGRPRCSFSFLSITSEMLGIASDLSLASALTEVGLSIGPADNRNIQFHTYIKIRIIKVHILYTHK